MFKEIVATDTAIINVDSLPMTIEDGRNYSINQTNPNSFTHGFFKYPCKFIPEIPRWAINKYLQTDNGSILDPYGGSGTTLLEGMVLGHNTYGTEIDNFAKLLIKVKTTSLSSDEIGFITEWLFTIIHLKENYHDYINPFVPAINNLDHWFTEENSFKLGILKNEIDQIQQENIRDFLNICFASIIRKCSNADEVSPKPYVSTRIEKVPSEPFNSFLDIVNKYLTGISGLSNQDNLGGAEILNGDATSINTELQFELAITSPPYINAFDYARTLRLENLWLGLETEESLRRKKKEYVGTENINVKKELENLTILEESSRLFSNYKEIEKVDLKRALIVKKFFEDMKRNLCEVHDRLIPNGKYVIVIGNSAIRNVNVESWKIIADIALNNGYGIESYFSYVIQNHYLRIPRGNRGGKINEDYILVLRKN